MRFGLERSGNGIYDRIVLELARGLRLHGHDCTIVDPKEVRALSQLADQYGACDWVIVTNNSCWLSQRVHGSFLFELLPVRTLFLHHDALSHGSNDLAEITAKVEALVRVKDRSLHLSIERGDVAALNGLGIDCRPIAHINTLGRVEQHSPSIPVERNVAFIGHAVPPQHVVFAFGADDRQYHASYMARLNNFTHELRADFAALLGPRPVDGPLDATELGRRVQYLQYCNHYTTFLRGSVLQSLSDRPVDLYGGDPAWLHGVAQTRVFAEAHVRHHPPVFDGTEVARIFAQSAVNLNITSLQFDTGLINRVLDCTAAGGFMLTDKKAQLSELTACADLISYGSVSELQQKIDYYADPAQHTERCDIVRHMQMEFERECSVERCVERMVAAIREVTQARTPVVEMDAPAAAGSMHSPADTSLVAQ